MKLTVFNGSPRGKASNTRILLDHFLRGFSSQGQHSHEVWYLKNHRDHPPLIETFRQSEAVLLAFPLYTDAMPAIVKQFIECLPSFSRVTDPPVIIFLVQSGFPEAVHSRALERYLVRLACRLGMEYRGTIVRGGVEGIKVKPPWMTRSLRRTMEHLGRHFASCGQLAPRLLKSLAPRERMGWVSLRLFGLLKRLGLTNFYWNSQLRRNNARQHSRAHPFSES